MYDDVANAATARDERFAARLLALDAFAAAQLLLRNGTLVDHEYGDHYYGLDATFTSAEPSTAQVALPEYSSFASIDRTSLADNAPDNDHGLSTVHKFVLQPGLAVRLNAQLRHSALMESQQSAGVVVSNAGGFHSATTHLDPALHAEAWHGPLRPLLLEALHALHPDGLVAGCPIRHLHLTAWLNVSSPACFNQPHDHGAVPYSAVYFVDDGGPSAQSSTAAKGLPACAGELLLQTQPIAWSRQYALHAVLPVPGTLWFFPGYMPHAVLPRAVPMQQPQGAFDLNTAGRVSSRAGPGDGDLNADKTFRISVACNVYGYEPIDLSKAWRESRRVVA